MKGQTRSTGIAETLERFSGRIIVGAVVITMLLAIPLLTMAREEQASQDPAGEVFELRDDLDERLQGPVHGSFFIAESRSGDILAQAPLWELYRNTQELLQADERGELAPEGLPLQPYLYPSFDLDTNRAIVGLATIADAVQRVLVEQGASLEDASDDQVKIAVHHLLSADETSGLSDSLSVQARSARRLVGETEIDYWTSPAIVFPVLADNEKLGGGTLAIGVGGGETVLDKEEFNRKVQERLRGEEKSLRLWGVAIDLNLETADEGALSGMFIMATVIAAVIIVGISLRSYWAMALTGIGLGILMVWLKGVSALIGLKGGTVIELIVPIAMVSLGVDFAVHAVKRYQEEKDIGHPPTRALQVGLAGVLGALVLAVFSDSIAFLSNVSSEIEAVVHFGVAAAIAVMSSFVVLGVVVPLALMKIDNLKTPDRPSSSVGSRAGKVAGGIGMASLSGTAVIFLVFLSPAIGLVVLVVTALAFVGAPALVLSRRRSDPEANLVDGESDGDTQGATVPRAGVVESLVVALARFPPVTLLVAAAVTVASVALALRLDPDLDPKDFVAGSSDFVVSLDNLDEHLGERGGEPGVVYIRGDLTEPSALSALQGFIDQLSRNPYLARDADGALSTETTVLDLLDRATRSPYAVAQVELATGVEITDADGNGIPDAREQVKAVYDYMARHGVPLDETTLVFNPAQVKVVLFHDPEGTEDSLTRTQIQIPDSREQTTVASARAALEADLAVLSDNRFITRAGLTGSPFAREAQLQATTKTLQRSLPIAAAGVFLLLLLAMRSFSYAIVTIIPVGLVVAWLYGFMYLTGFSLNFVTATIGAISIGVGIDYSIHMTERFREELRRATGSMEALRQAARGTGVALVASASSSIVGFAIMGLAPMPMFASFGILTAVMIFLALAASLVVLPSLLVLVSRERAPGVSASVA